MTAFCIAVPLMAALVFIVAYAIAYVPPDR